MHGAGEKVTKQECCRILFDEFRRLAKPFAIHGPYRHLIIEMINRMQRGSGTKFHSILLNAALKEQILNDKSENRSFLRMKSVLDKKIKSSGYLTEEIKRELTRIIKSGKMPKFDRIQDWINGMGIIVHDIWATHITIKSLNVDSGGYRAVVHYRVQAHFGLDNNDIMKSKIHALRFFRIWFVLQRYSQFGFRPFISEMETTVEIMG